MLEVQLREVSKTNHMSHLILQEPLRQLFPERAGGAMETLGTVRVPAERVGAVRESSVLAL